MARTMQTAPQNTGDPPPTQSPVLSTTSSSAQSSPQISPVYRSPRTLHNNNNNRRGKDMNNETTAAGLACLQTQRQLMAVAESAGRDLDDDMAELQRLAEVSGTERTTSQQEQNIQVAKKRLIDAQNQQKLHLEELKSANALVSMAMKQKSFAQSRVDTSTAEVENAKKLLKEAEEEGGTSKRKRTDPLKNEEEGNKKPAAAVAQNTPSSTNVDINNNNVDDEVEGCTKTLFQGGDFLYMNP